MNVGLQYQDKEDLPMLANNIIIQDAQTTPTTERRCKFFEKRLTFTHRIIAQKSSKFYVVLTILTVVQIRN